MARLQETFGDLLASLTDLDSVFSTQAQDAGAAPRWTVTTGAAGASSAPSGGPSRGNPLTSQGAAAVALASAVPAAPSSSLQQPQQQQQYAALPQHGSVTTEGAPLPGPLFNRPSLGETSSFSDPYPTHATYNSGKRARAGSGASGGVKEQIHDLEAQLARKLAELHLLEQQNQKLKDRSRMLEVVIKARDEQVERLKWLRDEFQALQEASAASGTASSAAPAAAARDSATSKPVTASASPTAAAGPQPTEPGSTRVSAAQVPQPLGKLDAAALLAYSSLPIEALMGGYHTVVTQLTAELLKPNQGRLAEMMYNLKEFTRAMALMSDKLQLMVSRDVSAVAPLPEATITMKQSTSAEVAAVVALSSATSSEGALGRTYSGTGSGAGGGSGPSPVLSASLSGRLPDSAVQAAVAGEAAPLAEAVLAAALVPDLTNKQPNTGIMISDHVPHTGLEPGKADQAEMAPVPASTDASNPNLDLLLTSPTLKALESSAEMQKHWRTVCSAINLSPQQRADVMALWGLHQDWLSRVHADRQRLGTMLDEVLNVNKYGRVYQEGLSPTGFTEAQVLRRLHKNVQSEHALLMLVGEVLLYQILSLEQTARVLIQSWPFIPDSVGIMHAFVNSNTQP